MASESGTFAHYAEVHKWSEEQTAAAARQHQVDPDELTQEHFLVLGFEPDESLHIDHAADQVTHCVKTGHDGTRATYRRTVHTIDEWNAAAAHGDV